MKEFFFLKVLTLLALLGQLHVDASEVISLPHLNIKPSGVSTTGCSHAGDMAHQLQIAFSAHIKNTCVFAGQPYRCAVQKFANDEQVPQTVESSVPFCDGCDEGLTLAYDHCKNHPEWVDVGMLPDYVKRACDPSNNYKDCIDDYHNLFDTRAFLFLGTQDSCYLPGSVENVAGLYGQLVSHPEEQIKFVGTEPFPHTLPYNWTAHFNSSEPANYDGPGECLRHIYKDEITWAGEYKKKNEFVFDQLEFWETEDPSQMTNGTGAQEKGSISIPTRCQKLHECKMMIVPSKCDSEPSLSGGDQEWSKYGETNDIVVFKPCVGGYLDKERFPNAMEVGRGLFDVYGQLSSDYATQNGPHMKMIGKMLKRLMDGE